MSASKFHAGRYLWCSHRTANLGPYPPPTRPRPSLIYMFCSLGYFECTPPATLVPLVAAVCLVCTVVESLPVNGVLDDNLSVPAAAVGLSMLLLPLAAAAAGM